MDCKVEQYFSIFLNITQYFSVFRNIDCKVDQYFVMIVKLYIYIKLDIFQYLIIVHLFLLLIFFTRYCGQGGLLLVSTILLESCFFQVLDFYDNHDIWHFLSAAG